MNTLPTADEMLLHAGTKLDEAYEALSAAAEWLRSDWTPVGSPLTRQQAHQRSAMRRAVVEAKDAINGGRS